MKTRFTLLWIAGGLGTAALFVGLVLGVTSLLARNAGQTGALAKVEAPRGGGVGFEVEGGLPRGPVLFGRPVEQDLVFERPFLELDEPFDVKVPAGAAGERVALPEEVKAVRGPVVAAAEQKISGPFTHGGLAVYLVHGKGAKEAANVLTLQEALGRGLATVHEGGISIDNRSDQALFIQGGDVIKGGTQDRVLPYDYLIPAKATRFPVQAFCVESGRSFPRAGEISTSFSVSSERMPTKELRLAAYQRSQAGIWKSVSRLQDALATAVGGDVKASLSKTSLQLTLEHPLVQNKAQEFLGRLIRTPDKSDDVLGMVVVINGKIVSGDIYSSPELFQQFWPKLLKAAAVEAMAEGNRGVTTPLDATSIHDFLLSSESGPVFRQETGGLAHMLRREGSSTLAFDTCQGGLVLHRTLLAR